MQTNTVIQQSLLISRNNIQHKLINGTLITQITTKFLKTLNRTLKANLRERKGERVTYQLTKNKVIQALLLNLPCLICQEIVKTCEKSEER